MICSTSGCERSAKKRGMCPKHYHQQWKRANDAKPPAEPPAPITGNSLAWTEDAACTSTDPEMFYRNDTAAKQFCLTKCQVLDQCLTFAMNAEQSAGSRRFGVYGGKTPQERRNIELGQRKAGN